MPEDVQATDHPIDHQFILGIDFGQKRIGLAVGQTLTRQANPLITLQNNGSFWQQLATHIETWKVAQIVIGLPLDMDGQEQEITRQVKNFTKKVKYQTQLPVHWVDERLTSFVAERQFKDQRQANLSKAKGKSKIDAMAAQIILQSWFDQNQQPSPEPRT